MLIKNSSVYQERFPLFQLTIVTGNLNSRNNKTSSNVSHDQAQGRNVRRLVPVRTVKSKACRFPWLNFISRNGLHSWRFETFRFIAESRRLMPGVYEVARSRTDDTDAQESRESWRVVAARLSAAVASAHLYRRTFETPIQRIHYPRATLRVGIRAGREVVLKGH